MTRASVVDPEGAIGGAWRLAVHAQVRTGWPPFFPILRAPSMWFTILLIASVDPLAPGLLYGGWRVGQHIHLLEAMRAVTRAEVRSFDDAPQPESTTGEGVPLKGFVSVE